jgi:hypothetical protein
MLRGANQTSIPQRTERNRDFVIYHCALNLPEAEKRWNLCECEKNSWRKLNMALHAWPTGFSGRLTQTSFKAICRLCVHSRPIYSKKKWPWATGFAMQSYIQGFCSVVEGSFEIVSYKDAQYIDMTILYIYICMHMCIYMYIILYICIYAYICIYVHYFIYLHMYVQVSPVSKPYVGSAYIHASSFYLLQKKWLYAAQLAQWSLFYFTWFSPFFEENIQNIVHSFSLGLKNYQLQRHMI